LTTTTAVASPPPSMYSPFLYHKQPALGLDFSSFHSPADIAAPSVDSFELDLDILSQDNDFYQLEVTQVNSAYSQPILSVAGPGSAITRSSESSAQDTLSYYSEPFQSPLSTYSFTFDDMEFHKICVDDPLSLLDDTSFGRLPPTPPRSPPAPPLALTKALVPRTSYSDYSPHKRDSVFFNHLSYSPATQSTISPSHISTPVPSTPLNHDESLTDPRKKYKCPSCPRAFARAFNLKTHVATHDPNRLKPHICPHSSCARSFSRKHDLGRHLISIHRDDSEVASHRSTSSKTPIGVEKAARGWCDSCGKGFIGRSNPCDCHDIK
jgi:predicted RNA-binding Zn-ribbon protein involved in translation (DUF1610 family)